MGTECCKGSGSKRSLVGAVCWDGWYAGNEWASNLSPEQWRDRLPFYARKMSEGVYEVRGDSQEIVDQEIAYASQAGLSYWAYCYSLPDAPGPDVHSYGIGFHLASKRKTDMGIAFILMAQGFSGPKEEYARAAEAFAAYFRDPAYQKVLNGRPLVYIFYVEAMPGYFGSDEAVRAGLDLIRSKAVEAGLQPPYIVADVWNASTGADCVDKFGFDAVSAYAWLDFSHGDQGYPYRDLARACRDYWEACKATGKKVVPIVSAGWDHRPRWRDPKRFEELYQTPPRGPWYEQPTPQELAANLQAAVEWNKANSGPAEANTIIIYAWNESDEGGWLVPTISEGTARLDAVRKVLRR